MYEKTVRFKGEGGFRVIMKPQITGDYNNSIGGVEIRSVFFLLVFNENKLICGKKVFSLAWGGNYKCICDVHNDL